MAVAMLSKALGYPRAERILRETSIDPDRQVTRFLRAAAQCEEQLDIVPAVRTQSCTHHLQSLLMFRDDFTCNATDLVKCHSHAAAHATAVPRKDWAACAER